MVKSLTKTLEDVTKTLATTLLVERASAWFLSENKQRLICYDVYQLSLAQHFQGEELRAERYPSYFAAWLKGEAVIANRARHNPHTQELTESYLQPLDIVAKLDLPIHHKGKVVGIVCLEQVERNREWTLEEIHFTKSVTNFVCLAVESVQRLQAEQKLRHTSERLALINNIASSVRTGMSTTQVIQITLARLAKEFPYYRACYAKLELDEKMTVITCHGAGNMESLNTKQWNLAFLPEYIADLRRGKMIIIENLADTQFYKSKLKGFFDQQCKAILQVSLSHFDEQLGVVTLHADSSHSWKEEEIQSLQEVADFLELAIHDAKGQEDRIKAEEALEQQKALLERLVKERTSQLEHKAQLEFMVANLSTRFINLPLADYDQGIYEALQSVAQFCQAERCNFMEVLEDQDTSIKSHQWLAYGVESLIPEQKRFKLSQFPWIYQRLRSQKITYFSDINKMPQEAHKDKLLLQKMKVFSTASIPIMYGLKLTGVFNLTTQNSRSFWTQDDLQLFQLVGNMLMNAIERKKYEQELKHSEKLLLQSNKKLKDLATLDGLTGIANRRFFDLRLQSEFRRAKREQFAIAVILFDIDHFKYFNDEFGHVAGDLCLKRVATCIQEHCQRATEMAARYGGEEFVVVLSNTTTGAALGIAERIRQSVVSLMITAPQKSDSNFLTISGGIACRLPAIDEQQESLVKAADKALYLAKNAGRNCVKEATDDSVVAFKSS